MTISRRGFLVTGLAGATALSVASSPFALAQTLACAPTVCTIWAGQTNNAGTITVTNDTTNLYIDIELANGWTFQNVAENLKVWVGTDFLNMPQANGNPINGQFPFKVTVNTATYRMTIPLVDAGIILPAGCGSILHVVAHLDVTNGTNSETAYGGCIPGATGRRWWFYLDHRICCLDVDPPPELGSCETAFGKGQWVWTTDPKSNPEVLKSLNLTKNRWGWAINLQAAGTTSYELWAGAGLNKTASGTLVGVVTVSWVDTGDPEDGVADTVTVSYALLDGYRLAETHVYASKAPPATIAPGQYGHNSYHSASECTQTYSTLPLPLIDNANGDTCRKPPRSIVANPCSGVWIVAHAVVCDAGDACVAP